MWCFLLHLDMNFLKSIELVWSLLATNIILVILVLGLIFYLFKIKRKQTFVFYYKNIRNPLRKVQDAISDSLTAKEPSTPEQLYDYHNASLNTSDTWFDPYTNTTLLSFEMKRKFCLNKIESVKKRFADYYIYTNGRIKPEDLFEFLVYKQELDKIDNA